MFLKKKPFSFVHSKFRFFFHEKKTKEIEWQKLTARGRLKQKQNKTIDYRLSLCVLCVLITFLSLSLPCVWCLTLSLLCRVVRYVFVNWEEDNSESFESVE